MLNSEGMLSRKTVKNNNRQLCTCSTLFLYISLPLFCTTTTWNFQKRLSYTFYGGTVVRFLVHFFFSLPLIFTLHWYHRPLAFVILSPPLQNFHVVLPTKICLLCFLSLFIALFLVWASLACRPLSYFSVFHLLYIPNLWTWQFI